MFAPNRLFLPLALGVLNLLPQSLSLQAQEEREYQRQWPMIHYELLKLIPDDTTRSRLDVIFNIPPNFFVYVRTAATPGDFIARGEISVEVFNSRDLSVAREITRKELHRAVSTFPDSQTGRSIQGDFSFSLEPGTYRVLFEVNDFESGRRFVDKSPPVVLKKLSDSSAGTSDIVFLEHTESIKDSMMKVYPINLGGDAVFGKNFIVFLQSTGHSLDSEAVHFNFHRLDITKKRTLVLSDSIKAIPPLADHRLMLLEGDSILTLALQPSKNQPNVKTYLADILGDTLQWGQYDIEMKVGRDRVVRKSFTIRWLNMPRVLSNVGLASEALEYLMPEKEFDEFMKQSTEDLPKQLEDFWKKRDPTPQTAYNEAMAEYYYRCDYAFENFRTLSQANGIKTDRGKIYILYGPPTKSERFLIPNSAPKEVWYYEKLDKKFIFVDESRAGNYKLLSSEKL